MENNNNKRKFDMKKFLKDKKVAVISALVVVLIATGFIINGIGSASFALPKVQSALPDSFKAMADDIEIIGGGNNTTKVPVTPYYAITDGGNVSVFCLENNVEFGDGLTYTKGDEITDYGLLYLMANAYPNKAIGNNLSKEAQIWITQIAIWDYLYQIGETNNSNFGDKQGNVKSVAEIYTSEDMTSLYDGAVYTTYIKPLVEAAIANRFKPNKSLDVKLANNNIALTSDGKYYQSAVITVVGSPSDNFNGFNVGFKTAPAGSLIIDEEGKEIKEDADLTSGTKFYVRVPVDRVTEENSTVQLSVTGSFRTYEGNYYTAKNADGSAAQTITNVKTVDNNVSKGLEIKLNYTPDVPDTGMTTAQTLYFVGFIVLISGIGIVYASVKQKENN